MAVYTDVSAEELGNFLAGYDLGELLSYKGIAEGVENSNFLVHTGTGHYILTLYEKRVAAGDVPFFLALMEHLPSRGITCPQPVQEPQRRGARHAVRPAGRDRHLPRRHVDAAAGRRPLRRGRRGAGAHASRGRGLSPASAATRCRSRGWRPLFEQAADARRRRAARPARDHRDGARPSRKGLAARPAAGRHPRRPVSRQRVLPGRQAVGPDRLLFRLHRHARLRRRHLPQRLVLRARPFLQRHQGPQPARPPTSRPGRCRTPSSTRCRCWRAARRCASC